MSKARPVVSRAPWCRRRSMAASCTPRPCCSGFVPPRAPVGGVPGRWVIEKRSANSAREPLKPGVLVFARLLPITSIQLWWARSAPRAAMKEVLMGAVRVSSGSACGALVRACLSQDLDHGRERHVLAVDAQHGEAVDDLDGLDLAGLLDLGLEVLPGDLLADQRARLGELREQRVRLVERDHRDHVLVQALE